MTFARWHGVAVEFDKARKPVARRDIGHARKSEEALGSSSQHWGDSSAAGEVRFAWLSAELRKSDRK